MPRTKKHRKLPNGFGQITYIPSRMFQPYRAMITVGHDEFGKPICKLLKPVSYFDSYTDAFAALLEYNKNPRQKAQEMTLKQLFDEWLPIQEMRVSSSSIRRYRDCFKRFKDYQDELVINVTPRIIAQVTKNAWMESPVIGQRVKTLSDYLFDYAVVNEIITYNYSKSVQLNLKEGEVQHHISFTDDEIRKIWAVKDKLIAKWVLVQCYTGMRPGELCDIRIENINLEENYIVGGNKTKAGRNRKIPIHPAIKSMVAVLIDMAKAFRSEYLLCDYNIEHVDYQIYRIRFVNLRKELDLNPQHALHDCRKFFVTIAKKYHVNDFAIKRIVGHEINDVTEGIYTERDFEWIYSELLKIPV